MRKTIPIVLRQRYHFGLTGYSAPRFFHVSFYTCLPSSGVGFYSYMGSQTFSASQHIELLFGSPRMGKLLIIIWLTPVALFGGFVTTHNNVHAKTIIEFECMPDQIRSPSQDGLRIIGDLSGFDPCNETVNFRVPTTPSPPPLVISVHGGGGKKDAQTITDEFHEMGYATLIFDAYNMNGIALGRIGNAYRQMMLLKTSFAAYEWVRERQEINQNRIYFYGISNGASVVLNIADMVDPSHVKGVIAEAPTPTGIGYPRKVQIPIKIIFGTLDDLGAPPGKKRWEVSDPCRWNLKFDLAPEGFAAGCNFDHPYGYAPNTMEWIKSVERENGATVDVIFVEGAAHAAFLKDLHIGSKKFGGSTVGWSLGGTTESRDRIISEINAFIQ